MERSFNDAVDELFQHTLCAWMPSDTFRFVIYTKIHVWIHWSWWLLEKHNFPLFCNLHGLSWRGSFGDAVDKQVQHTLIQIFVFPHILYKTVRLTYLITKKTSTAYSSPWIVERAFNDAVDELFQHTLTAHMLSGTFKFVIFTKFHVWKYWS